MRSVVVAYEHHLGYDLTGYPTSELHRQVTLFGNIVAVADRYDALTTARSYRKFSFSPHEVISYLLYYAGTSFDPMVTKLFVELMGLFPPGTMLRLDNGEAGVVCEPPPPGRSVDAPRVRLWTGPHRGEVIDVGVQPDGTTVTVAMVLSPDGMGQVPAMDLSMFRVVKALTPEDLESMDDGEAEDEPRGEVGSEPGDEPGSGLPAVEPVTAPAEAAPDAAASTAAPAAPCGAAGVAGCRRRRRRQPLPERGHPRLSLFIALPVERIQLRHVAFHAAHHQRSHRTQDQSESGLLQLVQAVETGVVAVVARAQRAPQPRVARERERPGDTQRLRLLAVAGVLGEHHHVAGVAVCDGLGDGDGVAHAPVRITAALHLHGRR